MFVILILRKRKKSTAVMEKILWIPISYIIAHLCIKGVNSKSYLATRDFSRIILVAISIYFVIINSINLFKKLRYKKKEK